MVDSKEAQEILDLGYETMESPPRPKQAVTFKPSQCSEPAESYRSAVGNGTRRHRILPRLLSQPVGPIGGFLCRS